MDEDILRVSGVRPPRLKDAAAEVCSVRALFRREAERIDEPAQLCELLARTIERSLGFRLMAVIVITAGEGRIVYPLGEGSVQDARYANAMADALRVSSEATWLAPQSESVSHGEKRLSEIGIEMVVPLRRAGAPFGALLVARGRSQLAISDCENGLVANLGDDAGTPLYCAELNRRLHSMVRDSETARQALVFAHDLGKQQRGYIRGRHLGLIRLHRQTRGEGGKAPSWVFNDRGRARKASLEKRIARLAGEIEAMAEGPARVARRTKHRELENQLAALSS